MVVGAYAHLDDLLASQNQSIDWTQHATNQRSISWGNLLAPGTMHEKTHVAQPSRTSPSFIIDRW